MSSTRGRGFTVSLLAVILMVGGFTVFLVASLSPQVIGLSAFPGQTSGVSISISPTTINSGQTFTITGSGFVYDPYASQDISSYVQLDYVSSTGYFTPLQSSGVSWPLTVISSSGQFSVTTGRRLRPQKPGAPRPL